MTKVEFFLLGNDDNEILINQACDLIKRAVWQRRRVYIHTSDPSLIHPLASQAEIKLNMPIARTDKLKTSEHPIAIGTSNEPDLTRQVLLNLDGEKVPSFFSRFEETWELISGCEKKRELGRDKYRFYRDRGYPLKHRYL